MKDIYLSVIIPVYNEEGNIASLNQEIKDSISGLTQDFEIIYVNDGSLDNTLREIKALGGVTIIDLNRNYGQATALDAGFKFCTGKYVVSLDGDNQNDPRDIKTLLDKLIKEDLDVVTGWRKDRRDGGGMGVLTHIGRFLRQILINDNVHDTGCTLRVYKREAVKCLDIGGEMHRYILAILKWKGFRIREVVVNHRPRTIGKSKYNYFKAVRGFIDLVYIWFIQKYSQRPLHLFGYASFFLFLGGLLSSVVSVYQKIAFDLSINRSGYFLVGAFMILTSIILFSFGIVIDLLIRIQFNSSQNEKRYYVREIIKK
ncbi:MAG: glycosyltransferase family 2 protein [Candidatus Paceibacterota bacterium]|jgi:glycosyltransferase involved in cell wall biosynthesis